MPSTVTDGPVSDQHSSTVMRNEGLINRTDLTTKSVNDDLVIQQQSIRDFLEKPFYISTVSFTTTNAVNDSLFGPASIGSYLASNSAWANKISGYAYVRGTAVITITMNANPFQQGKVLLHYLPGYTTASAVDAAYAPMHNVNITSKRMQPCVEIDLRDSGGVIKIPYIAPTNFYDIKATTVDWGSFYLTCLAPLRTGASGETSTFISVYLHFEDFELAAPTVPQGPRANKKYMAKSLSYAEKEALNTKPLSSALSTVASIANDFSVIPYLTSIATPIAWTFDGLAGIASFFGWSKVKNESPPSMVARQSQPYSATSDGVDNSYPLALRSQNQVRVMTENSISDHDEMSFNFLKTVSTVVQYYTWTGSQVAGTSIVTGLSICPRTLYSSGTKVISTHTATYGVGPPLYYLSNVFQRYRGSIKFVLKIVKTDFHSGRLQVTFTPTLSSSETPPTLATSTLSLREIIDVRCGSEFTFTLPYLLALNYINVTNNIGFLDIIVLNELRNPETASSTVDLLMYWSCGEDFEFQCPLNAAPLAFSPQMDCSEIANDNIGGSRIPRVDLQYAQISVGEYFTSVKQLINRNNAILLSSFPGATTAISVYPFFHSVISMNASGILNAPTLYGDVQSYIGNCYAFYRGGMTTTIYPATQANYAANLTLALSSKTVVSTSVTNAFPTPATTPSLNGGSVGIAVSDYGIGCMSTNLPYYSTGNCSFVTNTNSTTNVAYNETNDAIAGVNYTSNTSCFASFGLLRAARDDYQYTYFIGCPPVLITYV